LSMQPRPAPSNAHPLSAYGHSGGCLEFRKLALTLIGQFLEFADFLGQPFAILTGKPTGHPGGVTVFLVGHEVARTPGRPAFRSHRR
ncbi:MAG: hypothetical protein WCJ66_02525, partial [Verrucomicrobiota bacterium]